MFIKVFRCETYFIIPINSKRVNGKSPEVVQIIQFMTYTLRQFTREVEQLFYAVVEPDTERITVHILSMCYGK